MCYMKTIQILYYPYWIYVQYSRNLTVDGAAKAIPKTHTRQQAIFIILAIILCVYILRSQRNFLNAQQGAMLDTVPGYTLTKRVRYVHFIGFTKASSPLPFGNCPPCCYYSTTKLPRVQSTGRQPTSFVCERVFQPCILADLLFLLLFFLLLIVIIIIICSKIIVINHNEYYIMLYKQ